MHDAIYNTYGPCDEQKSIEKNYEPWQSQWMKHTTGKTKMSLHSCKILQSFAARFKKQSSTS